MISRVLLTSPVRNIVKIVLLLFISNVDTQEGPDLLVNRSFIGQILFMCNSILVIVSQFLMSCLSYKYQNNCTNISISFWWIPSRYRYWHMFLVSKSVILEILAVRLGHIGDIGIVSAISVCIGIGHTYQYWVIFQTLPFICGIFIVQGIAQAAEWSVHSCCQSQWKSFY